LQSSAYTDELSGLSLTDGNGNRQALGPSSSCAHERRSADMLQTAIASFAFCFAKKSLAASQGHAECRQKNLPAISKAAAAPRCVGSVFFCVSLVSFPHAQMIGCLTKGK